ncbi:MAG TPA: DUF4142 domain-containing protein [Rhizomicrobium sp.]|jgi:putative membrane protein
MSCKLLLSAAALTTAFAAVPAFGQTAPPTSGVPATNASVSSQEFVKKAAITGIYEIGAARIAEQRSHDRSLDRFAARMIRDHGKNSSELKAVAKSIGLGVPERLDEKHRGLIEQLRSVGSRQFDATYDQQQIQGHREAIALFTGYMQHGDNPRLRQFAKATLPVLEHHLHMAQALPVGPKMAGGR